MADPREAGKFTGWYGAMVYTCTGTESVAAQSASEVERLARAKAEAHTIWHAILPGWPDRPAIECSPHVSNFSQIYKDAADPDRVVWLPPPPVE